jgi:hypothetical protein
LDPIVSLPFSEYAVAVHLAKYFKQKAGYSIFVPLSRQEKGVDLILAKRHKKDRSKVVTIQVKASRTYSPEPPKKGISTRFSFFTWFNRFDVPVEADLFALIGLYPPSEGKTKKLTSWWDSVILIFTNAEMASFMKSVKTVKGTTDKMFGFGFDHPNIIFQTRGDSTRSLKDYSDFLLKNRIKTIWEMIK